jgi:hypothetical protein
MLRLIFVFLIIAAGVGASLTSPFYALLFYLWNAYFRPDEWTYGGLIASLNLSFVIGGFLVLATAASLPRPRFSFRIMLMALFFIHSLVSALLSEDPYYSWSAWVDFAKVLIVS